MTGLQVREMPNSGGERILMTHSHADTFIERAAWDTEVMPEHVRRSRQLAVLREGSR